MSSTFAKPLSLAAALSGLALLAGCGESQVRIYDAPKDAPRALPGAAPAAAAEPGHLHWEKAPAWQELPPTAFRKGNYVYTGDSLGPVEITVSSFPGEVGGLLANVNRWLGQAELPPVTQEELERLSSVRSVGDRQLVVVDLGAAAPEPTDTRIFAAVTLFAGQSWFFKMSGPRDAVESQIAAFEAMLDGLEFHAEMHAPQASAAAAAPQAARAASELGFEAPTGWAEKPGSPVRLASYEVAKDGLPPADFSITSFPGDTGGVAANVNRWRAQIGLPAWGEEEVARRGQALSRGGQEFLFFDLKAETAQEKARSSERILAAILQREGRSWFFKLRGDALLVDTQRGKFLGLLDTVTFGPGGTLARPATQP